jgi:hypothetical protein
MHYRNFKRLTKAYELAARTRALRHSNQGRISKLVRRIVFIIEYQFLPHYFGRVPRWRVLLRRLSLRKRVIPDVVVTGPIKGGSSDLASHLMLHPGVIPPLAKEVPSSYPERWRPYYPTEREMARATRKTGSARTCYFGPWMHRLRLMDNVRATIPDAKIVIALRDPVDRAFSHWKWEVLWAGREAKSISYFQSFDAFVRMAIDLFPGFPMDTRCGVPFLRTGIYHKAVELWFERFGRENVLVLDAGAYFRDRGSVLSEIYRFLDLPDVPTPDYPGTINENPLEFDPPEESTRCTLGEFYQPYNTKLYDLLNVDFGWYQPGSPVAN